MTIPMLPISDVALVNPRYSAATANGFKTVAFLPMAGLSEQGFIASVGERQIEQVSRGYTYFEEGDVLLAKITPCLENGKAAVACNLPHRIGFGSTEFHVLRPKEGVDTRFLFYMIWNPFFRHEASRNMTGSAGQKRVPADFVSRFKIPLPPLPEQRRIVTILDKADAIRRKREEGIRLTEELLRSTFLEMFGDPVRNDHRWPVAKVRDAGEVQLGRQRAPKYQTGKHTRPYIRVANVFEDRIDLTDLLSMDFDDSDFRTYRLKPGDILLNEGQSTELVGRPALWRGELDDCCFQNTLVRFRAVPGKTEPEFALEVFLYYLRTGQFAKISSKTSNVAHLGAGRFAEMPFPMPPIDMQRKFAERRRKVVALLEARRSQIEEANDLFGSLVQRAFRGEL